MMLKHRTKNFIFFAAFCLLALSSRSFAQRADSVQVNRLLADARSDAIAAEYDEELLTPGARGGLSPKTHLDQLERMRSLVQDLGKIAAQLNGLRAQASPWQQVAIDRISPRLVQMSERLKTSINLFNSHQDESKTQMYRDFTQSNDDLESRTAATILDFIQYGKARSTAERLRKKLELPFTAD